MIKNEVIAKQISELMLEIGDRLDRSVAVVHENCSLEEFSVYRRIVGTLMDEILLSVLNPLYGEHPSLKPLLD